MVDEIDPQRKKDVFQCVKKAPPVKECPSCGVIFHARIMTCPSCGFKYDTPEATAKHGVEAYSGAVMSDQLEPFLVDVTDTWVSKHSKPGKTPSVKFEFYDKMERSYPIWLCLDHQGYAREKALALVRQMGGKATTVEEALKEWPEWKKVERIQAKQEGKFVRVTGFQFKPNQSQQQKLGEEE
jgi:DNA repair protein RadD